MAFDPSLGGDLSSAPSKAIAAGKNTLPPPAGGPEDVAIRKAILDRYGPGVLAYYEHPELGPLIRKANEQELPQEELLAQIRATQWYRERATSQRNFDIKKMVDPATVDSDIAAKRSTMARRARTLGISVTESELNQLATDATRNGLNDSEIDDLLFSYFDTEKAASAKGSIGGSMARIKRAYAQYGMPISDATAAELGKQMAMGELDDDGLLGMLIEQTKARYPQMASLLDQGVTPKAYFAPIKETVAQTLELNPESIDIFDPKYSSVLNMPLYEVQKWARSQDEWKFTDQANKQANQVVDYIARTFGKVA